MKRNQINLILAMLMLFFSQSIFSAVSSYKLPITRNDVTKTRVAYSAWGGEYPRPVINVNSGKQGYTKISAYKSLRKLNQKVVCNIKNGLYHPWSKTSNSAVNYYTITALQEYKAIKNTVLGKPIKKGTLITNVYYLAEGYCTGSVKSNKRKLEFQCDQLDSGAFKNITPKDNFSEQWLYVKCREGYNAFVKDSTLLKQAGIKEGRIRGYGSVSP